MQRIREPRLLLVEGRDEVNLFKALINDCFDDDPGIQVIDARGKDKFSRNLKAIQTAAMATPVLQSIGVVRDADDDAGAAFDSVCDGIRSVNYEPPMTHGGFSNGAPAVGVFIVPDGVKPGAIETLCRQSRLGSATAACVDEYLNCLGQRHATGSRSADKSWAHAYLAAAEDPVARVGEGALQGVWDFTAPAFAPLAGFLHQLARRAGGSPQASP